MTALNPSRLMLVSPSCHRMPVPLVVGSVTDVPGSALPRFCDPRCPSSAVSLREVLASALSASARSEVSLREVPTCPTLKFLYER